MAQGAWCYRACPYGRPGNAVYCGSEDANGNCPSSCDCPPKDVLRAQGGDFGGSLPKPPTSGKFSKASGKFMRRQKGGTGQPVQWKKQSGKFMRRQKGGTGQPVQWKRASGEIFGLSTQQALIAVGVGVAAYFIIKKLK
jgi:hypothetical protein